MTGPLTWLLVGLLAVFGVLDAFAHTSNYRYGETFSALVKHLEKGRPLVRAGVAGLIVVLFTHLVLGTP